jgi:hypothetical protein
MEKAITLADTYDIEYSKEFNDNLNVFSVIVGDAIKDMSPLEKYYVLKTICEELEGRASVYVVMGDLKPEDIAETK